MGEHSYRASRGLRALFAVIVVVMLVTGLAPHGYRFHNDAKWLEGGKGVRFGQFGIAYTARFVRAGVANRLNESGLTILLGLIPAAPQTPGFQFIASFSNGDDATQLVVAQWHDALVVMNGDDYAYDRRLPRLSADLKPFLNRPILLAIVTSASGTELIVDGEVVARDRSLQFFMPVSEQGSRVTLGNSVRITNGWAGALYGFALIPRALTSVELQGHRDESQKSHDVLFLASEGSLSSLRFADGPSSLIRDTSGSGGDAIFPTWPVPVERSFLADDPIREGLSASRLDDVAVNLIGFIPFGLVLAAIRAGRRRRVGNIVATVTLWGFFFSLGIETAQAWIPTRSSSAQDLLLNTASAALGACLWRWGRYRLETRGLISK